MHASSRVSAVLAFSHSLKFLVSPATLKSEQASIVFCEHYTVVLYCYFDYYSLRFCSHCVCVPFNQTYNEVQFSTPWAFVCVCVLYVM